MTRLRPPGGATQPPAEASFAGTTIELRALAQEICRRYRAEFRDEADRYGDAGIAWCVHDNQHILNWVCLALEEERAILARQIGWLASILAARDFPLDRLRRNLELAASVVTERVENGDALAKLLLDARRAAHV